MTIHGIIYANAKDYYNNYYNISVLQELFTRIENTPDLIPQKGDIAVWGEDVGNINGHVAIATGDGDTNWFDSYDQNWGKKEMHLVTHNYRGFLGVLRPKDQSKINPAPDLRYKAHIQRVGWTDWVNGGDVIGTEGECKRIEAIILEGNNGLDLRYRVHSENIGWSNWVNSGEVAGTTGQGLKIEAIEIEANKNLIAAEHIQDVGWMPDSKGKNIFLGTQGKNLRLEAFKANIL